MSRNFCNRLVVGLITLALLAVSASPALASAQDKDKGKDKDKKEKKSDQEKLSKQERAYIKFKRQSKEQYDKDPAFREEVESAYRHKQREHSEYAFFINTRDARDDEVTRTGDRLKIEDTLYDNPMVQDYVNRVGHSVVPKSSKRLYAFKVTLNPIPEARSLSTGTIYVSSGLLSKVDNEAQLAYVLGHEVAHIEKDHWYEDVMIERGVAEHNEKQEQKRKIIGGLASVFGGPLAGALGGDAALVSLYATFGLPTLLKIALPNAVLTWDKIQEDEADQLAIRYMLDRSYDPTEVRKFYANLLRTSHGDRRASLGFMADAERIVERVVQVDEFIGGIGNITSGTALMYGSVDLNIRRQMNADMQAVNQESQRQLAVAHRSQHRQACDTGKQFSPASNVEGRMAAAEKAVKGQLAAEFNAKLDAGELIGTGPEFAAVMAELRRDNGIRAFYYDMFQMARDNLEESLMIRSNDPQAHLYYGKVLKLTARTGAEKQRALSEFVKAIENDKRRVLPEARLHRALSLMEMKDTAQTPEIVTNLKEYVNIYRSEHGGALPPNMDVIYDYFQEVNEMTWTARPATHVSDRIEPAVTQTPSYTAPPQPTNGGPSDPPPAPKKTGRKGKP